MRRFLSTVPTAVGVLVLTAAPALAAEGTGDTAKGSFGALGVAAILGVAFGIALTVLAYRRQRFGSEPAHHQRAHDHRGDFTGHDVGQEELAELEQQEIEPPAGTP